MSLDMPFYEELRRLGILQPAGGLSVTRSITWGSSLPSSRYRGWAWRSSWESSDSAGTGCSEASRSSSEGWWSGSPEAA